MPSTLKPEGNYLLLKHDDLLRAILKAIQEDSPFKPTAKNLGINCLKVAETVYKKFANKHLDDLVRGRSSDFSHFGANPFEDDHQLREEVAKIYRQLHEQLDQLPSELWPKLLKTRADLGNEKENLFAAKNTLVPFKSQKGQLQPVTTGENAQGDKLFRAHLCRIRLTTSEALKFEIQEAILAHYKYLFDKQGDFDDSAWVEIQKRVKEFFSEANLNSPVFKGFQSLLDEKTLGLIKREAEIAYLECLLVDAKARGIPCAELETLVQNIRLVEEYINSPERTNEECIYHLTANHQCDLRDLLGNAEAFRELPVIGQIEGNLEERTGHEERVFVFGMRFKLNGVSNRPENLKKDRVYAYHLKKARDILSAVFSYNGGDNSVDTVRKLKDLELKKAIRVIFLYYIVFSNNAKKCLAFWQNTLSPLLSHQDMEGVSKLIKIIDKLLTKPNQAKPDENDSYEIEGTIITLILSTLQQLLNSKTGGSPYNKQKYLFLDKKLLNDNLEEVTTGILFAQCLRQTDLNSCLRYVRISEKQSPLASFFTIPFNFSFKDTFFMADRQRARNVQMTADLSEEAKFLPVLVQSQMFKSSEKPTVPEIESYQTPLMKTATVLIQLIPVKEVSGGDFKDFQAFIYRFTSALIFHLCLSAVCQKLSAQSQFYIPLVRIHTANEQDPIEHYLKAVTDAVAFLLNERYSIGTQGIQLVDLKGKQKSGLEYRITNARNSLYSFLPKRFEAPGLVPAFDKLAIVTVSTRVTDKMKYRKEDDKFVNLFGKVALLEKTGSNLFRLRQDLLTFADNRSKDEVYQQPNILLDTIDRLYGEYQVRDILYVAKAPFTSSLNLTATTSRPKLYFMSEEILLKMLENHKDLNLYPVFCDKYPIRMFGGSNLHALYIDEVSSIQSQLQMDEQRDSKIIMFLNIANGIAIKEKGEYFFNRVLSYSTLDKFYKDTTLDSRITERLVSPDSLARKTLIEFLCLVHAAAFEKTDSKTPIQLKLNPYEDILGDENVNALNTFGISGATGQIQFNLFAFLTKIQRIVRLLEGGQVR